MRVGEVAKQARVSVQTVRLYERLRIIDEPRRFPSGYRNYLPDAIEVVRFTKQAQRLGFTLREVTQILAIGKSSGRCEVVRSAVRAKLQETEKAIRDLQRAKRNLVRLLSSSCYGSEVTSCSVIGTDRKASKLLV